MRSYHVGAPVLAGITFLIISPSTMAQTCFVDGAADTNGDCVVDPLDTGFVLSRFGCDVGSGDTGCDSADANKDGIVDPLDSGFVLARFCTGADNLSVVLDDVPTSTSAPSITLSGITKGAIQIEAVGGIYTVLDEVIECAFDFDLLLQPDRTNFLFLTAIAEDGTRGPAIPVTIIQDSQAPSLFIDFPTDGAEFTTETTDVAGRVSDLLSGFAGLTVTINGIEAEVDVGIGTNGTFLAPAVPLEIGPNPLTATATDFLGNTVTKQITITGVEIAEGSRVMTVVSGNGQIAEVNAVLPEPIVVKVTSVNGKPQVGKVVTFQVNRNDGRVAATSGDLGSAMLQVFTDANGEAQAFWRLGGTAGCGNNRIEVTSNDVVGSTFFCASGAPGAPDQINVGTGNMQRGEAGGPAPENLVAWVSDSCNPVAFVPVTFSVLTGGGLVNGQSSATVLADLTGHASVQLELGPDQGNNVVEANTLSNTGSSAVFTVFGTKRVPGRPTSFSGIILNNAQNPIQGATCELEVGDLSFGPVYSDIDGRFVFTNISTAGAAELIVEGATAFHVGGIDGRDIPLKTYPALHYALVLTPEAENGLGMPVLLPPKNTANNVLFDNTQDVELTCEGIEGLKMIVKAGSVRLADGTLPSPSAPTVLSLNQVHHDDIPMPMPDGVDPPFAWTLQPGGTLFDPPVEIIYPNMTGLPAGAIANFLSFNHDTMRFEIVASGQVSADGQVITSDPGAGISTAGWGCNCPPYSVTSSCCHCNENCQACVVGTCITTCEGGGACCGDGCCEPGAQCCGGNQCIAAGSVCCPDHGAPCSAEEQCCGSNCCGSEQICCEGFGSDTCCEATHTCCGTGGCCPPEEQCCNEQCIPKANTCCDNGTECFPEFPLCCGNGCCVSDGVCCNDECQIPASQCCDDGRVCSPPTSICCDDACCKDDEVCCGGNCAPPGSNCCEIDGQVGVCSPPDSVCCPGGCAPDGDICCENGGACPANKECCGDACCPVGEVCCAGTCFPAGSECCGETACSPPSSVCCEGGTACCPDGTVCCDNTCQPAGSQCCSNGTACNPPDSVCCADGCCPDDTVCCGGECQPAGSTCCPDGHLCDPGFACCGASCCETGAPCCDDVCGPIGGGCCNTGTVCDGSTPVCCENTCCASGEVCCGGNCAPAGSNCCEIDGQLGVCSPPDSVCCPGGCAPDGDTCCENGGACPANKECCGDTCCPVGEVCCAGTCFPAGSECCGETACSPPSSVCCDGGTGCCPDETVCCGDTCEPAGSQCCSEGVVCNPPDSVCCADGCCPDDTVCCGDGCAPADPGCP